MKIKDLINGDPFSFNFDKAFNDCIRDTVKLIGNQNANDDILIYYQNKCDPTQAQSFEKLYFNNTSSLASKCES